MTAPIPTRVARAAEPSPLPPRRVAGELRAALDGGAELVVDGSSREDPRSLLADGYAPRHRLELFGTTFWLADVRQNPLLRFFVAYVAGPPERRRRRVHARILYKDVSLLWRAGSHVISTDDDLWIGKGDVRVERRRGREIEHTWEATSDLPFELQDALDVLMRATRRIRQDTEVLTRVLRNAPPHRIAAYRDFTAPRRRAAADPRNLVNGGRRVARFTRRGDPRSLAFVPGFEPDFARGRLEVSRTTSKSYGGSVELHRILSRNRRIQHLFFAAPRHVWLAPPQALTTELSTYGVRTVTVAVDDDVCIPGYEYHFHYHPDDPASLHSQIPEGYVGEPNPSDPDRADASAWLEELPVVRRFRREVLGRRR